MGQEARILKKPACDNTALPLGQAALEELIEEITVDAHGEDEQLWAFRQVFEDSVVRNKIRRYTASFMSPYS